MFTVVIAEKEHIDSIQEYSVFLKPFIEDSNVEFCQWRPEETTLADSVPHLTDVVARHQEWRAIVLCDEQGLKKKNPFELVEYKAPEKEYKEEEEDGEHFPPEAYLEKVRQTKFQAFEQAAHQPLTRLMTQLCEWPMVSKGKNNIAQENPEFAEYLAEHARKQELREQIVAGEKLNISRPTEIICVAKRTYTEQEYDINTSWSVYDDIQYSRFYDWNMYFDKMRYVVFDILPKGHRNYEFDYIRFLYAMMILANNDTPADVLKPNRVFCLNCENDEAAIDRLLSLYDTKLIQTEVALEAKINSIQKAEKPRLSDREAAQIFCARINIPVTLPQEIDREQLYAKTREIGLSTDCPTDEYGSWDSKYMNSCKALLRLLKQPRRALKRAVDDMRRLNEADLDKAGILNEFQIEDIQDYTGEEEVNMVSTITPNLFDTSKYDERMERASTRVHRKIETRMTKKTTIALGLTVLGTFLIGFLPLLFNNLANAGTRTVALAIMGVAVGVMGLICLMCLLFLREALCEKYREFNRLMGEIDGEIESSTVQFSRYLSHVCNVMRGFSVLNYREKNEEPCVIQLRVLEKHRADIRKSREELHTVFGHYISGNACVDVDKVTAYPYDFMRTVDYTYPIPYTEGMKRQIEYMNPGSQICVPVDFVKRITVRREELYD